MKEKLKLGGPLVLAALVLTALACGPKPQPTPAAAVKATPTKPAEVTIKDDERFTPKVTPTPTPEVLDSDLDALNRKGYLKDVYFDFDKFDIRQDQRDSLDANSQWLRKWGTVKLRVEGHCDERGTAQYNLALGEKRANSVKEYLTSLGIEASRIEIVSFGKERPFATGSDEAAWAQNRRGHFVITAR